MSPSAEQVDQPLVICIYPGADASFLLYEDDGCSFDYRKGEWMGMSLNWNDTQRTLTLSLARGSRLLSPARRMLELKLAGVEKHILFSGDPIEVRF